MARTFSVNPPSPAGVQSAVHSTQVNSDSGALNEAAIQVWAQEHAESTGGEEGRHVDPLDVHCLELAIGGPAALRMVPIGPLIAFEILPGEVDLG